ncbi:15-hydroxyprostaglandin dehydrogenase [NAD(+)]-like [Temnothorax longispinosus]
MDNVESKTAIVTGAGAGIGYHITEDLLRKGAKKVAILDLPVERCYNATVTLQEKFGKERVIFFPIDVTNLEAYNETFKQVIKAFNGLDILVNNAGICNDRCFEQTFAVNVIAVIRGSLLALDYMGKHKGGKGGTIVNVASMAGLGPFCTCPVYCSSKYAVVGFGSSLEKSYVKTGVRILTICPGFTETAIAVPDISRCLDFIDEDYIKFLENINEGYKVIHNPQSVVHVAQSTVMAIQKGKNGSIWVIDRNEPAYSIKLPHYDPA